MEEDLVLRELMQEGEMGNDVHGVHFTWEVFGKPLVTRNVGGFR